MQESARGRAAFGSVIVQIVLLNVIFSLDAVITAVGMVEQVSVMIAAVTITILAMMISARTVGDFVRRHPTVKMLALSFMLLIGFILLLKGFDRHVLKGCIYFAMGFAVFVEFLNLRVRGRRREAAPLHLQPALRKRRGTLRSERPARRTGAAA